MDKHNNNKEDISIIAKQSAMATVVSYLGALLGFLTTFFILPKILSPSEIGLMRILLEVATLVSSIGLIGLSSSIYRFYPYFKDNNTNAPNNRIKNKGFFFYITIIATLGMTISSLIYLLFKDQIAQFFIKNSPLFIDYYETVIPFTFFLGYWIIFELYAVQMMKVFVPKIIREVGLRLLLLITYILYAINFIDINLMIYLYVAVYGISMLLSLIYLNRLVPINFKHNDKDISNKIKKDFWRYTGLYTVASIGSVLASRMDLFMLSSIDKGGLYSAGVFTIAFYMVAVIEIPSRVITSMATPRLAELMKNDDIEATNMLFKKVALYEVMTAAFIFVCVWASIDSVYSIMPNGELYAEGKWVFLFLGLAKLSELFFNFGGSVVSLSKYYHWNLYYTLVITLTSFIANIYLIPIYGTSGAAIATLISISISYALQQALISNKIKVSPMSLRMLILFIITILSILISNILPSIDNIFINIILRSSMVAIFFILSIMTSKIAPEAISFVKSVIVKINGK